MRVGTELEIAVSTADATGNTEEADATLDQLNSFCKQMDVFRDHCQARFGRNLT